MKELLLALIAQLNSSVIILLFILIIAFILLYKMGMWAQKFTHQDKRILDIEKISSTIIEVKTKVDLVYQIVNPNYPVTNKSPLTLTETGEEIIKKIKAETILKNHISELSKEIESLKPKNAYDIQEASIRTVQDKMVSFLDEKELIILKEEAYSRGILIEDIMSIFAVLLRNHTLNERDIPIADVDKHQK